MNKPSRSGRMVYSVVCVARIVMGLSPQTSTNARRHVCRYVDQKGLAAMLTSIQSASVAPEVNLRNPLCAGQEARKWGNPPWLWNPGQTSPQVQNRGISGPRKGLMSSKNFKKKKKIKTFFNEPKTWITIISFLTFLWYHQVGDHANSVKTLESWNFTQHSEIISPTN